MAYIGIDTLWLIHLRSPIQEVLIKFLLQRKPPNLSSAPVIIFSYHMETVRYIHSMDSSVKNKIAGAVKKNI